MNFELKQDAPSRQIEKQDIDARQDVLLNKIQCIALIYADKKFQELVASDSAYSFASAVQEFSPLKSIITQPIFNLPDIDMEKYEDKIDIFLNDCYQELESIYRERGLDLDSMSELIMHKLASIKEYLKLEMLPEGKPRQENKELKLFDYNVVRNIEQDEEGKFIDLKQLGYSKLHQFLEIHVKEFYQSSEHDFGSDLIKQDLAKIAEHIIDIAPETEAVIGKSWLLDTRLAQRLGFKQIAGTSSTNNDFSTWFQFIDRYGGINQKRLDQFLQSGELPFKCLTSYMPTMDFLQRFLPENRRGRIVIRKLKADSLNAWREMNEDSRSLQIVWLNSLKSKEKFDKFLNRNEFLNELLSLISAEERCQYVDFLRIMYQQKIAWCDFWQHQGSDIASIKEKMQGKVMARLYQDEELYL